jgi:uncharacterized protein
MAPLIQQHREEIEALCRRFGVKRLELFGSAASRSNFDPATSDVDFFYVMDHEDRDDLADRYFDFHAALEQTLGRPVDLVSLLDVRNPYFLQVANRHRTLLYAA